MKKLTQNPYALTPELIDAHRAAGDALKATVTQREQVDLAEAQLVQLEDEAARLETAQGSAEGDAAMADDDDRARLEAVADQAQVSLNDKLQQVRRMKARIKGLEEKAAGLDADVATAANALSNELGMWNNIALGFFASDLREALKPLLPVLEKARAIGGSYLNDFLAAAYIPNPEVLNVHAGQGAYFQTNNLLKLESAGDEQAEAIRQAVTPIRLTLNRALSHTEYVPLSRRPKPYVRKGYTHDGITNAEISQA